MTARARVSQWTLALCAVALLACSRGGSSQPSAAAPAPESTGSGSNSSPIAPTAVPTTTTTTPTPMPAQEPVPTGENAGQPRSGTANPFDEHGSVAANTSGGTDCQRDDDCVCGIDRSTGACAIGPASRVDTARQCPDFCSGIGGQLRVVCDHGRCAHR